jgi:hypothetical protein
LGTKYSGAGGATPGRWALRSCNVMQSNEEGPSTKQQWNDITNQWALEDSRWYHVITAEQPPLWAWALNVCADRGPESNDSRGSSGRKTCRQSIYLFMLGTSLRTKIEIEGKCCHGHSNHELNVNAVIMIQTIKHVDALF